MFSEEEEQDYIRSDFRILREGGLVSNREIYFNILASVTHRLNFDG